jgi:uncharacterized protein (TIGR02284 family)
VAELQLEVERLAADPVGSGHPAAALRRGWIDIKAGVTGRDEGAVIADCGRGEDEAVQRYQEALNAGLPADLRMMVDRQFHQVKEAHAHIRSLERAHSRLIS